MYRLHAEFNECIERSCKIISKVKFNSKIFAGPANNNKYRLATVLKSTRLICDLTYPSNILSIYCKTSSITTFLEYHSHLHHRHMHHTSFASQFICITVNQHHSSSASQFICVTVHLHHSSSASQFICITIHLHHNSSASQFICITVHLHHNSSASQFICITVHLHQRPSLL